MADLTRYAEVPLDTPDVRVDFSRMPKQEVAARFPCYVKNKEIRCDKPTPDSSNWYCSRIKGHDGPHVGYDDHRQSGGPHLCWYDGDTKSITPPN